MNLNNAEKVQITKMQKAITEEFGGNEKLTLLCCYLLGNKNALPRDFSIYDDEDYLGLFYVMGEQLSPDLYQKIRDHFKNFAKIL